MGEFLRWLFGVRDRSGLSRDALRLGDVLAQNSGRHLFYITAGNVAFHDAIRSSERAQRAASELSLAGYVTEKIADPWGHLHFVMSEEQADAWRLMRLASSAPTAIGGGHV